ncbi:tetratricopeptide repeat protein [Flavobacterium tructae]|uniref:tetratricopeptide repeat protein n=1 Tax=Flavobacterium tructae TaxID=1114873 RepID=UPI0035A97006
MTINTKEINNQGVLHFLNNDFEKAKNSYFEILSVDSENTTTLNNLGFLYLQEGKFNEAETAFLKAYQQTRNKTYALNLGHSLAHQGRYEEAENYYKISLDKDNIMGWKSLVALYEFTNQTDKAIETLSTIVIQVSVEVSFKIQLAKNYIRKELFQEALDVLQLAGLQEDSQHEVWYYIAYIHFKKQNFDVARTAIKTSIEYHNSWENSLQLAGAISIIYNDMETALKYWDELLQNNPANYAVRVDKAVVLLGNQKEHEASLELLSVLESDPENLKAVYYLGNIYISKKETKQKGIELLSRLIQTNNSFSKKAIEIINQNTSR